MFKSRPRTRPIQIESACPSLVKGDRPIGHPLAFFRELTPHNRQGKPNQVNQKVTDGVEIPTSAKVGIVSTDSLIPPIGAEVDVRGTMPKILDLLNFLGRFPRP